MGKFKSLIRTPSIVASHFLTSPDKNIVYGFSELSDGSMRLVKTIWVPHKKYSYWSQVDFHEVDKAVGRCEYKERLDAGCLETTMGEVQDYATEQRLDAGQIR